MADERRRFDVSVVTPEGPAYEGDAEMLIVPGAAGEIGVLARHAPLIATLKAGKTRVHLSENEVREFATGPGFFQVQFDRAIALVDDAVNVQEIDSARAQQQLEEARAELERIVGQLERGETGLEEAIALWERGEELYRRCVAKLDAAQARIEELGRELAEREPEAS
jgi:F-type H+-transporting ATPase subunit epsilon